MANPNMAEMVAEVYRSTMFDPRVQTRVMLQTKDGRQYLMWLDYPGKTVEHTVEYRTRYQKALFDATGTVACSPVFRYLVYQQRTGRSQTRLRFVPDDWHRTLLPIRSYPDGAALAEETRTLPARAESLFQSEALLKCFGRNST